MMQRYRHLDDLGGSIVDAAAAVIRDAAAQRGPARDRRMPPPTGASRYSTRCCTPARTRSGQASSAGSSSCARSTSRPACWRSSTRQQDPRAPTGVVVRDHAGNEIAGHDPRGAGRGHDASQPPDAARDVPRKAGGVLLPPSRAAARRPFVLRLPPHLRARRAGRRRKPTGGWRTSCSWSPSSRRMRPCA